RFHVVAHRLHAVGHRVGIAHATRRIEPVAGDGGDGVGEDGGDGVQRHGDGGSPEPRFDVVLGEDDGAGDAIRIGGGVGVVQVRPHRDVVDPEEVLQVRLGDVLWHYGHDWAASIKKTAASGGGIWPPCR